MPQNDQFYVRNFFYLPKKSKIDPQETTIVFRLLLGWFFRILFTFFDITRPPGKTVWVVNFILFVQSGPTFWGIARPKIHPANGVRPRNVILTFCLLQAALMAVQKIFENFSLKTTTIVVCPIPKNLLKSIFDKKQPKKWNLVSAIFLPQNFFLGL